MSPVFCIVENGLARPWECVFNQTFVLWSMCMAHEQCIFSAGVKSVLKRETVAFPKARS